MADTNILRFEPYAPTISAVPETVHSVRLRRMLTQTELAESLGKPGSWVSKIEKGALPLTGKELLAYASVLRTKPELLCEELPKISSEAVYFRKYDVPKKVVNLLTAEAAIRTKALTQISEAAGISLAPRFTELDCSKVDQGVVGIARIYRKRWDIGDGPIKDLAGRIENEGVHLSMLPRQANRVAGFSTHKEDGTCCITMFNPALNGNTQRFTIAHEFGHLVMDRLSPQLDVKEVERRADAFAGELLAPYLYLQNDIRNLRTGDVASLMELSDKWGLHPKSFIARGRIAGDISEHQATTWYKRLNGTSKILIDAASPPYPIKPRRFGEYINRLKNSRWTVPELEQKSMLYADELKSLVANDSWPFANIADSTSSYKPLQAL